MNARLASELAWMGFSLSCAAAAFAFHSYGWAALNLAIAAWDVYALDTMPPRRGRRCP